MFDVVIWFDEKLEKISCVQVFGHADKGKLLYQRGCSTFGHTPIEVSSSVGLALADLLGQHLPEWPLQNSPKWS